METYMYLALVSKIIPDDIGTGRSVADDRSLAELGWLQGYSSFGTFFEYALGLFEKIPLVQSLARQRLIEWRTELHLTGQQSTSEVHRLSSPPESDNTEAQDDTARARIPLATRVADFLTWLKSWKSPEPTHSTVASAHDFRQAGEVYRQALLIYIKACCMDFDTTRMFIADASLGEHHRHYPVPSESILDEIDEHLEVMLATVPPLMMTSYGATLLWPSFIAATCFRTDKQRLRFARVVADKSSAFFNSSELERVIQMLRLLWSQQGRNAYGPFGLEVVLKENNFNLSMA